MREPRYKSLRERNVGCTITKVSRLHRHVKATSGSKERRPVRRAQPPDIRCATFNFRRYIPCGLRPGWASPAAGGGGGYFEALKGLFDPLLVAIKQLVSHIHLIQTPRSADQSSSGLFRTSRI